MGSWLICSLIAAICTESDERRRPSTRRSIWRLQTAVGGRRRCGDRRESPVVEDEPRLDAGHPLEKLKSCWGARNRTEGRHREALHERQRRAGPRRPGGLALTVVAGLLADSFQRGVALSHGGEAIGHAPGSGANIVVALGIGSRVR
jgi:hypothetical protein